MTCRTTTQLSLPFPLLASHASLVAVVQQLAQDTASVRQAAAAPLSAPTASSAPPSVAPALSLVPHPPPASAPNMPVLGGPPHTGPLFSSVPRRRPKSDLAALVKRFSALPVNGDSDDEDTTVPARPHAHTARTPQPTTAEVLPATFVPPPVGFEHSVTQQLAAIYSAFNKQGGKVEYSTIEELNEALDDLVADALKASRSAQQVESIRAYPRLPAATHPAVHHLRPHATQAGARVPPSVV